MPFSLSSAPKFVTEVTKDIVEIARLRGKSSPCRNLDSPDASVADRIYLVELFAK